MRARLWRGAGRLGGWSAVGGRVSREGNHQHLIKKARQFCPPVLWTRGKCSVDDFSRGLSDKIGEIWDLAVGGWRGGG